MESITGVAQELLRLGNHIWGLSALEILRPRPSPVPVGAWATPPLLILSEPQETSDPAPPQVCPLPLRLQLCSNCLAKGRNSRGQSSSYESLLPSPPQQSRRHDRRGLVPPT